MDPFRALFLRQVRQIVTSKPGPEALHQLLKIVSPELKLEEVGSAGKRNNAIKELKLRIHNDKTQKDTSSAALLNEVEKFVDACCRWFAKDSTTGTSTRGATTTIRKEKMSNALFPSEFKVTDKWPFIAFHHPVAPETKAVSGTKNTLDIFMAYRCVNARGCIAHGTKPGLFFGWNKVEQDVFKIASAEQLFQDKFKGATQIKGVEAIKQELTTRGPVLSTSFVLTPGFANSTEYMDSFSMDRINKNHPVLIIGWKLTTFGEVWLVRSYDDTVVAIAFGQFGIDKVCLAPESNLEHVSWQSGPFLDVDMSSWPTDWMTWTTPDFLVTSTELENLSECFEDGLMAAKEKRSRFVVRNKNKRAHSRVWYLEEIKWIALDKMWNIKASAKSGLAS